jgi:hypothetical protein
MQKAKNNYERSKSLFHDLNLANKLDRELVAKRNKNFLVLAS